MPSRGWDCTAGAAPGRRLPHSPQRGVSQAARGRTRAANQCASSSGTGFRDRRGRRGRVSAPSLSFPPEDSLRSWGWGAIWNSHREERRRYPWTSLAWLAWGWSRGSSAWREQAAWGCRWRVRKPTPDVSPGHCRGVLFQERGCFATEDLLCQQLGVPRMYCPGVQELPQGTGYMGPRCFPGPGYEVVSGVAALLTAASLSPCPWLQQKAVSPAWSRERAGPILDPVMLASSRNDGRPLLSAALSWAFV